MPTSIYVGRPRRTTSDTVTDEDLTGRLRRQIIERHQREDAGQYKKGKRDGMTAPARRDYQATCEPGGPRYWMVERAHKCHNRETRVALIAEYMSAAEWRTCLIPVLAKAWGCGSANVRIMSSEASRQVRLAMGGKEELRTRSMAFLEEVAYTALQRGDNRSAITATRTFAEIAGILSHRHEITGANGGPIQMELRSMSDDELDQMIIKAAAEVVRQGRGGELGAEQAKALLTAASDTIADGEIVTDDESKD